MKKINVEKYKLSEDRLIDFGFQFEDNILVFKRNILNDMFRMEIKLINTDFEIEVYDLDFNEVYSLFSVDSANGEIVTAIREEVKNILIIFSQTLTIIGNITRYIKSPVAKIISKEAIIIKVHKVLVPKKFVSHF